MKNLMCMKSNCYLMFVALMITSCAIQLPKFSTMDKVTEIKTGMIREQVELKLGVKAYDIKSIDDNGNITVVYKYRVSERKVDPDNIQPTNGRDAWGKFGELYVTYSKDEKVISANSCIECESLSAPETKKKKRLPL